MRFILVPAALTLLGAAPPAASPRSEPTTPYQFFKTPVLDPQAGRAACPETPMSLARKQTERPELRRLDQLPDAQAFAAVDRRVDGCPAPMLMTEVRR